jgi:hypothetical protein
MAGNSVERKSRKRREKAAGAAGVGLPSQVVCTAHDAAANKNSVELALVFSLIVIALYLYGFGKSIEALPVIATGRHLGDNLNIVNLIQDEHNSDHSNNHNNNNNKKNLTPKERVAIPANNNSNNNAHNKIPFATWPVTLKEEVNDYETMIHAGDKKTRMLVPKFWAPPLHNKQPFTREQAMQVGTCVEGDPTTGSHVRGDQCPTHQRTIFVAIASYRDYQCRFTVESIFKRAKYPDRVRVGKWIVMFGIMTRSCVSIVCNPSCLIFLPSSI